MRMEGQTWRTTVLAALLASAIGCSSSPAKGDAAAGATGTAGTGGATGSGGSIGGDLCRTATEPACVRLEGCPTVDGGAD